MKPMRFLSAQNPYLSKLHVHLPKFVNQTMRDIALEKGLPISRLVQIAIDNELVTATPFEFDCSWPESEFIENAYIEEATRVELLLKRFPWGIGLDALTLLRHDVGVQDKERFIYGVRELFQMGKIEFRKTQRSVNSFQYPPDYEFIFLVSPGTKPRVKSKSEIIKDLQMKLRKAGIEP
jgi:hypothetical protein